MMLRCRPAAVAQRHQASSNRRGSQLPGCGVVSCPEQRLSMTHLLTCAAFNRNANYDQNQPTGRDEEGDQSSWATNNVSSGQIYPGNIYSHDLPWKGYTRMMSMAIEAEADGKQEMQDAYDGCLDSNTDSSSVASSLSMLEGDSSALLLEQARRGVWIVASSDEEGMYADNYHSVGNRFCIDIPTPNSLPSSTAFTQHVQKAMEAQGTAQELRQAADDEAHRFFNVVRGASGTGATCRENWPARTVNASAAFMELEASLQQGIQAAHDQFVIALRLAKALLQDTQRGLTNYAEKLRLEMSLQPASSKAREHYAAALQELHDFTEETMDDLAARLTSQFLPACNLSTDEARDWLEELWMLDLPAVLDSNCEEGC